MPAAALPDDEIDRLQALHDLAVLDSPSEAEFDALVQAAAAVCGTPLALLTLVDAQRVWIKAQAGLPGASEVPRGAAPCAHTILGDALLEVPDARLDARLADSPLVTGAPGLRFYAGVPLHIDGRRVGALCVCDVRPRQLDAMQREVLGQLATAAAQALRGRRALQAERRLREQAAYAAALVHHSVEAEARATQALREERRRLAWLIEATGAATWEWNVQTNENRVNERWAGMLGWTLQELGPVSLQTWQALAHPQDLQRSKVALQRHLDGETALYECEARLRHRDGHWVWVHDSGRVMTRTADGAPEWMFGMQMDITERKSQEERLRRNEAFLQRTGALAGVAGWELRLDTGELYRSPQLAQLRGDAHAPPPGTLQEALDLYAPEGREQIRAAVDRALAGGGGWDLELPMDTPGSTRRWLRSVGQVEHQDGRPMRLVGAVQDITEQRRIAAELRHRATHDTLTGLVNRAEFELRLQRLLARAGAERGRHALLYIDLDQFKLVNDACGHAAGDRLLQQVAQLLGQAVRSRDTLARLGGDEFAVLLEHCGVEAAQQLAQHICRRMDDYRFASQGQRFRIGASIGLVPLDERWTLPAAVMQAADTACYAAKENGRNRVHLWLDSDEGLRARQGEMQLATRLEQALDENRFELYAQRIEPLEGAAAGVGLHAEVLVRLRERDGTLVLPGAFLPAAERFHLASRIDRWVLARGIELLRAHGDLSGIEMLSINLSGQSIGDREFHRDAMALLGAAGAPLCRCLCLEITETAAVTNMAEAVRFVAQAHALGIRIALDDFGAGASSFGYLKSLAIDQLKIDGQFVRNLLDDALDDATVRCFQSLARVVGVKTVAEFVDRPDVLARLREIGVDYAQGFLLHKPEPAALVLRAAAQALLAP